MRSALRSTVTVLCILAISITGLVLLLGYCSPPADARAVQIQAPAADYPTKARNPAIYVARMARPGAMHRWFYAELADGSQWMVTRCRTEDSANCWWDAHKRGNRRGHSFVNLHGEIHRLVTAAQP